MKSVLATLTCFGCVALLTTVASAASPDYYPLNVNDKWTYDVKAGDKELVVSASVAKIEKIDDKELARIDSEINGKVATTEHLTSNDTGVYRARYNGVDFDPPVQILRYPIKEGETWDGETKAGSETFKYTVRVAKAKDEVEVPAGKFETVKVEIKLVQNKQSVDSIYWFADGVGIVKQEASIQNTKLTLELQKFEKGTDKDK